MTNTPSFCIQDTRSALGSHIMLWRATGGYDADVLTAGQFTWADALAQHKSRRSDVPLPMDYLKMHARRIVDVQRLRNATTPAPAVGQLFYAQARPAGFDGNSPYFSTKEGGLTVDLDLAVKLAVVPENSSWFEFLPVSMVDECSSLAVEASKVNVLDALGPNLFSLLTPKPAPSAKSLRRIANCMGCGQFLPKARLLADACARCH